MLEQLPQYIAAGLARAQKLDSTRRRRLRLQLGDAVFPILRHWNDGFAIDATRIPRLRGFVEVHEGATLLWTCLIVASRIEDGELICTYKRMTPAADRAAADYELPDHRPAGLLPRF